MSSRESQAEKNIRECITNKSAFLDLGNCNLNDNSYELSLLDQLEWLEGLNLGTYYFLGENRRYSENIGETNKLTSIPNLPNSIKQLFCNGCGISEIKNLNNLKSLTTLDAWGNNITDISKLGHNPNLISLGLSKNKIRDINSFPEFNNLKSIYLGENNIGRISSTFFEGLKELETLYLYNNSINSIEFVRIPNYKLKTLVLYGNSIKEIIGIKNLINLEFLEVQNNAINDISEIVTLQNLEHINLSNNKIKNFNGFIIEEFKQLKYINLFGNPNKFPKFDKNENNYFVFKEHHEKLTKYEKLIEKENLLKTTTLDLTDCGLETIPKDINKMIWLTEVILNSNNIHKIEHLDKLLNLTKLKLFSNKIEKIENLETLTNLKYLTLRSNLIVEINGLEKLTKLERLNLSDNLIKSLLPIKFLINKVRIIGNHSFSYEEKGIFVGDNPLVNPPLEIVQQGNKSVLAYFELIDKESGNEKYFNKHFKIILLGNSEAGKTEFLKQILGVRKDNASSTHFLEVTSILGHHLKDKVSKNIAVDDDTIVDIYDLGGQEYYHDTHKLYYTNKTIYLLFWENRTNKNILLNSIRKNSNELIQHYPLVYWLESINYILSSKFRSENYKDENNIKFSNKNSPVLVIENKIDLNENANTSKINQKSLMELCPFIYDFTEVSLVAGNRISQFKQDLSDIINYLNPAGDRLPNYYKNVIDLINTIKINGSEEPLYLAKNEFIDLIKNKLNIYLESKLDENLLIQYLNQKGIINYFKNDEIDLIILNSEKFRKNIFELFLEAKENMGFLNKESKNFNKEIIAYMKQYKLLFNSDTGGWVAPIYLNESPEPIVQILLNNSGIQIRRFIFQNYIHKSVILDIFSTLNKDNVSFTYFWRNGLVISKNETKIYLKFKNENDHESWYFSYLDIYILSGIDTSEYVNEIISDVREICYSWNATETVTADGKDFVDIIELNKNNEQGLYEFTFKNSNFKVSHLSKYLTNKTKMKKIFISYAKEDLIFRDQFELYLSTLKRTGLVSVWTDRNLLGGDSWDTEIKKNMNEADIIICLISPFYFADSKSYIWNEEIPIIYQKLIDKSSIIVPIILKSTPKWHDVSLGPMINNEMINFGLLNGLPVKSEILNAEFKDVSHAWSNVTDELIKIINK